MANTAILFTGQGFDVKQIKDYSNSPDLNLIKEIFFDVFGYAFPSFKQLTTTDIRRNEISAVLLLLSMLHHRQQFHDTEEIKAVAGYSVGQYMAMYFCEMIDLSALISLLFNRCHILNQAAKEMPATLAVILGLPLATLIDLISDQQKQNNFYVANENSIGNYTVAGGIPAFADFLDQVLQAGASKAELLDTAGAWHSPYMASAIQPFEHCLEAYSFKPPRYPLYDNVTGDLFPYSESDVKQTLIKHLVSTVKWHSIIKNIAKQAVTQAIELSDFNLLSRMGPHISRNISFLSAGQ